MRPAVRLASSEALAWLGAVQRHQAKPHQPRLAAQPQHARENRVHVRGMALAEPRNHRMVGDGVANNEAIADITSAQPLDIKTDKAYPATQIPGSTPGLMGASQ